MTKKYNSDDALLFLGKITWRVLLLALFTYLLLRFVFAELTKNELLIFFESLVLSLILLIVITSFFSFAKTVRGSASKEDPVALKMSRAALILAVSVGMLIGSLALLQSAASSSAPASDTFGSQSVTGSSAVNQKIAAMTQALLLTIMATITTYIGVQVFLFQFNMDRAASSIDEQMRRALMNLDNLYANIERTEAAIGDLNKSFEESSADLRISNYVMQNTANQVRQLSEITEQLNEIKDPEARTEFSSALIRLAKTWASVSQESEHSQFWSRIITPYLREEAFDLHRRRLITSGRNYSYLLLSSIEYALDLIREDEGATVLYQTVTPVDPFHFYNWPQKDRPCHEERRIAEFHRNIPDIIANPLYKEKIRHYRWILTCSGRESKDEHPSELEWPVPHTDIVAQNLEKLIIPAPIQTRYALRDEGWSCFLQEINRDANALEYEIDVSDGEHFIVPIFNDSEHTRKLLLDLNFEVLISLRDSIESRIEDEIRKLETRREVKWLDVRNDWEQLRDIDSPNLTLKQIFSFQELDYLGASKYGVTDLGLQDDNLGELFYKIQQFRSLCRLITTGRIRAEKLGAYFARQMQSPLNNDGDRTQHGCYLASPSHEKLGAIYSIMGGRRGFEPGEEFTLIGIETPRGRPSQEWLAVFVPRLRRPFHAARVNIYDDQETISGCLDILSRLKSESKKVRKS